MLGKYYQKHTTSMNSKVAKKHTNHALKALGIKYIFINFVIDETFESARIKNLDSFSKRQNFCTDDNMDSNIRINVEKQNKIRRRKKKKKANKVKFRGLKRTAKPENKVSADTLSNTKVNFFGREFDPKDINKILSMQIFIYESIQAH